MSKPFMTYEQLVDKLENEKGLSVPDQERVIHLLKEHSYYALISGYKEPFKAANGKYIPGTNIDDIYALYTFDSHLRTVLLGAILVVEKQIKSQLSYSFTERYGAEQRYYLDPESYNYSAGTPKQKKKAEQIKRLLKVLLDIATPPFSHKYVEHQWEKHGNVPLWVAVKAMTLGNISQMYSVLPSGIQSKISREYPCVSETDLEKFLSYLTLIRNVSAHNERLYNFGVGQGKSIPDMPAHKKLSIPKRNKRYTRGKQDLFAAIICLKYLLPKERFDRFIEDIDFEIQCLKKSTTRVQESYLLTRMGFPANWKDIAKL